MTSSDDGVTGTWAFNGASVELTFSTGITHTVEKTQDGWAGVYKTSGKSGGAVRYKFLP